MNWVNRISASFFSKKTVIIFGVILVFFLLLYDTLSVSPGFSRIGFPFNYRTVDTSGFHGFTPEFHLIYLVLNIIVYYLISVVISFFFNRNKY